jgi:hypothetical protein
VEGSGALWAGERRGEQLIDDRPRAAELVDVREVRRLGEHALGQRDLMPARGEPAGVLAQDRRRVAVTGGTVLGTRRDKSLAEAALG